MLKPILTRVFGRVARLHGIPEIQDRLDVIQAQLNEALSDSVRIHEKLGILERHLERRTQQQLTDQAAHTQQQLTDQAAHTQQQLTDLHRLLNEAQQSVMTATTSHTEQVVGEVRTHLETEINKTKRDLDNIRRMASTHSSARLPTGSLSIPPPPIIDDALYISLEDHFRGDKATVQQRQLEYVPYVSGIVTKEFPLIDLGCGRGEWLKVMSDSNIAASGIDSNVACIAECNDNGLTATYGELLDTLANLPTASCGAITMFQVLEHLPFDVVVNVLSEALRVLIPGGVFIGEVPNSETLRVGASTFWIDPTHQRPIFPAVLTFLASSVGFAGVTGKYSSPLAPIPEISGLSESATKTILDLHNAINGPGDFALIATA